MPPKKKGNKKQADDWDEGLGEVADPIAAATQAAKEEQAKDDAEEEANGGGGGLLAALKKNRNKKQKKGKVVEDFVEGEDPPGFDGVGESGMQTPQEDMLAAKAPEEANMEDEFDELPTKKGKGGKKGGKNTPKASEPATPQPEPAPAADEDGEDNADEDDGGRIKTKKEKEKEKKEREKARKKEQV